MLSILCYVNDSNWSAARCLYADRQGVTATGGDLLSRHVPNLAINLLRSSVGLKARGAGVSAQTKPGRNPNFMSVFEGEVFFAADSHEDSQQ